MTLWVFGYGSLLWNPGFTAVETVHARLEGYARSFCMRSIHHRGTDENPGLVLALDEQPDGVCDGLAMQMHEAEYDATMAYLRERELVSSAYIEKILPLTLADGRKTHAVTYVIDPDHVQYCGSLDLEEQAQIIAHAVGGRGANSEYLFNTATHLAELGIPDAELDWLCTRVKDLIA
ncbi:gamma-glutamylcyclotransferase [Marivita sp. XM-24bin2]|jgi:cation transport protein ChaC|uniref:gamma-glutamylcyclotransferase n=1 Tax=unclassified Marivita TaxID=2632480 RepID=UPI000D7A81F3|nr:gamma-glutamylcyclotransferase [Marivita sp. XM-24bin2]MCR9109054.1 gamma-glutamylcyclotransferase [Paracoccaceae bacterium]PWL37230.1 MAG: gamma-glutamylcyclotransferase [Marivita sp. XM-24bin2]